MYSRVILLILFWLQAAYLITRISKTPKRHPAPLYLQLGRVLFGITLIDPNPGHQCGPSREGPSADALADELGIVVLCHTNPGLSDDFQPWGDPTFSGVMLQPPPAGPTIGAFMILARIPLGGPIWVLLWHRQATWVGHTSDRLIMGSGRSCSPHGNKTGRHPLLFSTSPGSSRAPRTRQVSFLYRLLLWDCCQPPSAIL